MNRQFQKVNKLTTVEKYRDSERVSEASGITSSSKVRSLKIANNLYCYIDKRKEIEGKRKKKTKRDEKGT